jgi:hypothetical protein
MDIPRGLGEVVRASRTTSNLFDKLGIRRSSSVVLANGVPALDVDATRLHRFRQLELQLDLKQAVVNTGALDLNVISEIEAALE